MSSFVYIAEDASINRIVSDVSMHLVDCGRTEDAATYADEIQRISALSVDEIDKRFRILDVAAKYVHLRGHTTICS